MTVMLPSEVAMAAARSRITITDAYFQDTKLIVNTKVQDADDEDINKGTVKYTLMMKDKMVNLQ